MNPARASSDTPKNPVERTAHAPTLSIGMPVYNGAQFISQSLDSLLRQTFSDFEIIICDNASEDATQAICRDYARRDSRIRYYRNPANLGAGWNYRHALELAAGRYFKYAAHDDLCEPQFLQRCIEVLDRNPDVVLAYPKTKILDEISGKIVEYDDRQHLQSPRPSERFARVLLDMRLCNTIFGIIRTVNLRRTVGLTSHAGADIILMAELSLQGKFYEIPEYLFYRRFHPAASSSMKNQEELNRYLEPARQGRIDMREWRHLFGHLRSVLRTPLPAVERARLILLLVRLLFWKRRKLAAELLKVAWRRRD